MENPIYILKPDEKGYLVPRIMAILILGVLIYVGIILNMKFLEIDIGFYYKFTAIILAILLGVFAFLESYSKYLHSDYYFYKDRMYANKMWIPYSTISAIDLKRSIFDKLLGTSTIVLGRYRLKSVPYSQAIYNYVRSMIEYSNQKL